jgi:site-specific DNA-methyltransferase (cytosine-N4-specific)
VTTRIIQGNALDLPLDDDSVDLVVTSPPYFALRSYRDGGEHFEGQIGSEATPGEFLDALWAATAECIRVLKPSGSIFVNLGDKYSGVNPGSYRRHTQPMGPDGKTATGYHAEAAASEAEADHTPDWGGVRRKSLMGLPWRYAIGCIDDLGLILRAEVVWSKPNSLPESVKDRVRRSHEQWFHFTLEPRYFSAIDEIREPYSPETLADYESRARAGTGWSLAPERQIHNSIDNNRAANPLGKLPGSVWSIPSEPLKVPDDLGVDHFAAFPQEWPRRLILGWCPPDGVVLDPFAGTGTVPMVARALGRTGIGVDLSSDYVRLARWRVFESGHAQKSIDRTNRERGLVA